MRVRRSFCSAFIAGSFRRQSTGGDRPGAYGPRRPAAHSPLHRAKVRHTEHKLRCSRAFVLLTPSWRLPRLRVMQAATQPVLARFSAGLAALPKHARLREAIVGAVQAGELPAGTKMAGERELSAALGLSLGTTQKALGRLVDEGFLVRRQGHGTFVGTSRRAVAGSWHYRFLDLDGKSELPVFTTVLE